MSDGLRDRLIAATAKWRTLDKARDDARNEVLDAAAEMLKAGALPPEVVALTPFSDALVRAETRRRGAPKGKRGPKRNEESKPASESAPAAIAMPTATPFRTPAMPSSREAELMAMADELTPEREAELIELMWQRNAPWYQLNRRPGMTDRDMIRKGIRDGKLTASDLRN